MDEIIIPNFVIPQNGIKTTVDGGWRVYIDLPADKESGLIVAALGLMRTQNLRAEVRAAD